jgi:hypothetical protein
MIFAKKTPNIEFFSLIPEIAKLAPIVSASNFRPSFMDEFAKELSQEKKCPEYGMFKLNSTAKCPGIYNMYQQGWIMTTWQDIIIETNGDGVSYRWETPIDQREMENGKFVGENVSSHPPKQYMDKIKDDPNTLKNVLKIQTPWRCEVPNGYYLMERQIPYTQEKRFTTVEGFFSKENGIAQMNVQLLWHVMNGKTVIKAGTPIAHYMLIPKEQGKLIVRAANKKDLEKDRITSLEILRKFVSNRTESKCLFAKLFN